MKNLKASLGLVIVFCSWTWMGCEENNSAQINEPLLEILRDSTLRSDSTLFFDTVFFADNNTLILLQVDIGRRPARNETINITTTEGSLFPLNTGDFTSENKSLDISPLKQKSKFLLRTGVVASPNVLLSATIDKVTGILLLEFRNSEPDAITISAGKSVISLSSQETLQITTRLSKTKGEVSEDQRVSLTLMPDTLGSIENLILSNSEGLATATLSPLDTGLVQIIGSVSVQSDTIVKVLSDTLLVVIE